METAKIRKTAATDEAATIDTIVLAFSSDPVWRWCWPHPQQYLAFAHRFIQAFAGGAFIHDLSESVRRDLTGVLEQMAKYRPSASHWYLPIIGVDPMHQGKGYGGALLSAHWKIATASICRLTWNLRILRTSRCISVTDSSLWEQSSRERRP